MDGILDSVKQINGISSDYTAFDTEMVLHINSVFMTLNQLGVGPIGGFSITGKDEVWSMFLGESTNLEAVKSYMGLKVKSIFDPPTSSFVLESYNRTLTELEYRLNVQAEMGLYVIPPVVEEEDV